MQLGMIGLGRMGANMVRRLLRGGHDCVAYDRAREAVDALGAEGARPAHSLSELVHSLAAPRAIWIMVPASVVDAVLAELVPLLGPDDVVVDGGNSHYREAMRRAEAAARRGVKFLDVGTSGGVLGLDRGYCLMIGGDTAAVQRLDPVFATLAPGAARPASTAVESPAAPASTAAQGYLHCGPSGAGHFVKMVHNGIEYALMAAYAEGINVLAHADAGTRARLADAETAPLDHAESFQFKFDLAAITEVWRHGSIITSQLLDISAAALATDPKLESFSGRVSDSGEGRWTLQAAIEASVPAYVLSAALFSRFSSRGESELADKLLSAMRLGFGGHVERSA